MIGLNIAVDIYRLTESTDSGWNVNEESYPTNPTYRNVKARISTLSDRQKESLSVIGGAVAITAAHGVYFDADADVQIKDKIAYNGTDYRVVSIADMDNMGKHQEGIIVVWEGVT